MIFQSYEYGFTIGTVFLFLHALILDIYSRRVTFPGSGRLVHHCILGYRDSFHVLIADYKTGRFISFHCCAKLHFLVALIKGVNVER
jgi:hypothetical protein